VHILRRGNEIALLGDARVEAAEVVQALYDRLEAGKSIEPGDIDAAVRMGVKPRKPARATATRWRCSAPARWRSGRARRRWSRAPPRRPTTCATSSSHELAFGIGPAGTGKTYLAVAVAVNQMINGHVDKIILSRPAVEAGERLGFLPGDMKEKVDPYMQPLYDALHDFLPGKTLAKLIEEKTIEIAPLAFMRGRTLSNAYVVLDEAQNATSMQMKMFLTRLGQAAAWSSPATGARWTCRAVSPPA
jgi:phosphate starvation-inducible PhoH-like protein